MNKISLTRNAIEQICKYDGKSNFQPIVQLIGIRKMIGNDGSEKWRYVNEI